MYSVLRKINGTWKYMGTPYNSITEKRVDFHYGQNELLVETDGRFDPIINEDDTHEFIDAPEEVVKQAFKTYVEVKSIAEYNEAIGTGIYVEQEFLMLNYQIAKDGEQISITKLPDGTEINDIQDLIDYGDMVYQEIANIWEEKIAFNEFIDSVLPEDLNISIIENRERE